MSTHFHSLKVTEVIRETDNAVSIAFDIPGELKNDFAYKAGQYLNLKVNVNGQEERRSYSLCSCPIEDQSVMVTAKRVEGGLVSNYLNDHVKEGDQIEVMPPLGNFVLEEEADNQLHYVLIGAGSGITPLMSILRTVLGSEPRSKVTLIYGNRNEANIIFKKQLDDLQADHVDRLDVVHSLSQPQANWSGQKGRLEGEHLASLLKAYVSTDPRNAIYFLCGPNEMMESAQSILREQGVFPGNIHREYFSAPTASEESIDVEKQQEEVVIEASDNIESVQVIIDDEEHQVPLAEGQNILDAVLDQNIDAPYSCQSGICSTCRAKLLSGKIRMDEKEGLTEDEIKKGYILTCQSHPLTEDVKVEFD